MKKLKVIQFGLGAMGSVMARLVLQKKELELVGAVVRSKEDDGKDVGELIGLKKKTGVLASVDAKEVFENSGADAMLHAAVSYVPKVWEQIKPAVEAGINVVTIAEEMGYPFVKYPKLCQEMDRLAKEKKVSILGSGINPGFAMDLLPLTSSRVLVISSFSISGMERRDASLVSAAAAGMFFAGEGSEERRMSSGTRSSVRIS